MTGSDISGGSDIASIDRARGEPPDEWRYEVLLDGRVVDRVVRATAGSPGRVQVAVGLGDFEESPPGVVVIRFRPGRARMPDGAPQPPEKAAPRPLARLVPPPPPSPPSPPKTGRSLFEEEP